MDRKLAVPALALGQVVLCRHLLLSIDSIFGKERVTIAFRILKHLLILEVKLNGTVLRIGF